MILDDFIKTYLEAVKAAMSKDYKRLDPSRITSTVGLNTGQVEVTGMSIQFWDLGGQSELQTLWDKVNQIFITS